MLRGLLAAAATSVIRVPIPAAAAAPVARFGVISDVHQDIVPDGVARIRAFVSALTQARADFVIQLGDFCVPKDGNRDVLAAWNAFHGPRYHVLGNHDMDGGFTREQAAAFLGMPARHYTFDGGSFLGVVLDGNDPGATGTGYARYVAAYREPLWALVEVDRSGGEIRIHGRTTQWVGPPALERAALTDRGNRGFIRPEVGDRRIAVRSTPGRPGGSPTR
jgi:3',5'-cyclic AMP phosphodiesterase CpdA